MKAKSGPRQMETFAFHGFCFFSIKYNVKSSSENEKAQVIGA